MADIFISYKREDRPKAEQLSIALEQMGFDVWWDFDLMSGDRFRKVIREVIDQCPAAIVLWSNLAVTSDFVMDEASHAQSKGKLCPARLDDVEIPFGFGQTHTDDLSDWDGELSHKGFQSLVRALEGRIGRKGKLGSGRRQAADAQAESAELEAFKAAQIAGNSSALRSFMNTYPRGIFAGFVRGQLETMEAPAGAAAFAGGGAAPMPPVHVSTPSDPPPPRAPSWTPPAPTTTASASSSVSSAGASGEKKALPWPAIGGGAALLAALIVAFALGKHDTVAPGPTGQMPAPQVQPQIQPQVQPQVQPQIQPTTTTTAPATTSASYDISQLDPQVRAAVVTARQAAQEASVAATNAEAAAQRAQSGGVNCGTITSGECVFTLSGNYVGDVYAGQMTDNKWNGFGVYEFATNPDNKVGARLYEGHRTMGPLDGYGIYYWLSGERHDGMFRNGASNGPGVHVLAEGSKYEGEFTNWHYNGYGVLWNAQGQLLKEGIWVNNQLTTPLGPQGQ